MKGAVVVLCALALTVSGARMGSRRLLPNGCPADPNIHALLPHEVYCNWFYSCVVGETVAQGCPDNLVFNVKLNTCDWPSEVDCAGKPIANFIPDSESAEVHVPGENRDPSLAPSICARPGSQGVFVANEICNHYYVCVDGAPVTLECPDNLVFNYKVDACDWPVNVDCTGKTILTK